MIIFEHSAHPTTMVVTLSGHVDALHTLKLEEILEKAKKGRCHHVILNFAMVTTMDQDGLTNLVTWYQTPEINRVCLSIVAPPPIVLDMLESVHLTELIPIYASIPQAISNNPPPTSISS